MIVQHGRVDNHFGRLTFLSTRLKGKLMEKSSVIPYYMRVPFIHCIQFCICIYLQEHLKARSYGQLSNTFIGLVTNSLFTDNVYERFVKELVTDIDNITLALDCMFLNIHTKYLVKRGKHIYIYILLVV